MSSPDTIVQEAQVHELKTWPEFYAEVESGRKPFEIRKNDRAYRVGDVLWLREYEPLTGNYSGRSVRRRVTYLTTFGQVEGMVVLGLESPLLALLASKDQQQAQLREEVTELRQRDKVISRQLERVADGFDPLTADLRERLEAAEAALADMRPRLVAWATEIESLRKLAGVDQDREMSRLVACGLVVEDMHRALGIEFGENVYLRITKLLEAEAALAKVRERLEALQRAEHDRARAAHPLYSASHWQHNAGRDWPDTDDGSWELFENCAHPDCKFARGLDLALSGQSREEEGQKEKEDTRVDEARRAAGRAGSIAASDRESVPPSVQKEG